MWRERAERIMRRGKITIRSFNESDFDAEVQRCNTVYNGAMEHNWGFVSLTEAEFRYMAGRSEATGRAQHGAAGRGRRLPGRLLHHPARHERGRAAARTAGLFPYGLPINVVRFLWRKRHIKTARMIVLDVLEKYRRRGIAEMLILKTLDFGKNVAHYTGRGAGLDPGRQLPREPDDRGRGGQEVQDLPGFTRSRSGPNGKPMSHQAAFPRGTVRRASRRDFQQHEVLSRHFPMIHGGTR